VGRRVRPQLHSQALAQRHDDIDVVVVGEGKSRKGRVLGFVLRTIGRRVLERAFENSVKAIEARNGAASVAAV
jgi:hypothetical protein